MPFEAPEFQVNAVSSSPGKKWLWLDAIVRSFQRSPTRTKALVPPPVPITIQLLSFARAAILDKKDWTQGSYITIGENYHARRCAVSALRHAKHHFHASTVEYEEAHMMLFRYATEHGFENMEKFNDNSSHGAVIRAFDELISHK